MASATPTIQMRLTCSIPDTPLGTAATSLRGANLVPSIYNEAKLLKSNEPPPQTGYRENTACMTLPTWDKKEFGGCLTRVAPVRIKVTVRQISVNSFRHATKVLKKKRESRLKEACSSTGK
jgi:hypothetical protein